MWCVKCNKKIVDCTCPDIEDRLQSLANGPAGPSALQNLHARKMKQENKKAFTLVELMIVITIIAIGCETAIPSVIRAKRKADEATGKYLTEDCKLALYPPKDEPKAEATVKASTCPACVCQCSNDELLKEGGI